jgi:hypothetical protein
MSSPTPTRPREPRDLTYADYYNMRADAFVPNDTVTVKIVAVIGHGEQWAAYLGLSDWTDDKVARDGDKLLAIAAEALFPTIAARFVYRR